MSAIFFRRFLSQPTRVASIIPSSRTLRRKVAEKFDFSQPRIIAEFGPGEGCHTREILSRMHPESRLLLFELDGELAKLLEQEFRHDPRVVVLNTDAQNLAEELQRLGHDHCDYVVSGIPFSILEVNKKRALLQKIHDSLSPEPHSAFIIYQVTNELRGHAKVFPRSESEYCLQNLPPMFVTVFYRHALPAPQSNGKAALQTNGHHAH